MVFASLLSLSGVVSADEMEMQSSWLAERQAALQSLQKDERIASLTKLVQDGWSTLIASLARSGRISQPEAGAEACARRLGSAGPAFPSQTCSAGSAGPGVRCVLQQLSPVG